MPIIHGWMLAFLLVAFEAMAAPHVWVVLKVIDNGARVQVIAACQTKPRCDQVAARVHEPNTWTVVTKVPGVTR